MKKSILLLTASLGLATAPGAGAAGNLILNGNFATGDFTNWGNNWNNLLLFPNGSDGMSAPGSDSYFASTGGNGSISQTIATTIGTQYTLSFLSNNDLDNTGNDLDPGGSFSGQINGSTLFTAASIYLSTVNSWLTQSYNFTATTTSTAVELDLNFDSAAGNGYIDDISVTALSPVPEPSEWAAASVALLGLVYVAKRRFAQA